MRKRTLVLVLVSLLCLVISGVAQEITGTIVGTVKDSTGAVVPNATVTAKNTDQNVVIRVVKTSAEGIYVLPTLPVGHYAVTVDAAGFKKTTQTKIVLNVSDKLTFNFDLQVGNTSESITIEANPIQVEVQSATAAGLITGTQVRELSINNRNYEQLVALQPGVVSNASDQIYIGVTNPNGQVNTVQFAINGGRAAQNNWTVDGADNVDRGSNLTLLTYPSVDAISEFKVLRGLYAAETGRGGAGQVTVITRGGSSQFHGGAYEFFRNDVLNANTFSNRYDSLGVPRTTPLKRPALRYNDFGWTFGGPVYIPKVYPKKDKTFFFYSEEIARVRTFVNYAATVPTANEKNGIMALPTCASGFDATAGTCSNILPAGTAYSSVGTINPLAAAYIKDVWNKMPGPDASTVYNSHALTTAQVNVYNRRQELFRLDHVFSPKWQVNGRYLQDAIPTQEPGGLFGPNTPLPGVGTSNTNSPGHSWVIRSTANLTPNLLLESGYNYSYGAIVSRNIGLINPANSPNIANALKTGNNGGAVLPFPVTLGRIPGIVSNYSSIAGFGPYDDFNRDHNIFSNLSWIHGKHAYKTGFSLHIYNKTENAAGNNSGNYTFNSTGAVGIYNYLDAHPELLGRDPTDVDKNGKLLPVASCAKNVTWANQSIPCTQFRSQMVIEQAMVNMMANNAARFTQSSLDLTPDIKAHQFEAFVQDEFRIHPRITLSYGVRYSLFLQPTDANAFLTNFAPKYYDPKQAPQLAMSGNVILNGSVWASGNPLNGIIPTTSSLANCQKLLSSKQVPFCWPQGTVAPFGDKVSPDRKHDFAPRLGLAIDPFGDGKTSVRTGFGMFYDSVKFGVSEDTTFSQQPFVNSIDLSTGQFTNPLSGVAAISATPKTLVGSPINFQTPYSLQWSFDVQHEYAKGLIVDIGYYGSGSHHLLGKVDINQPLPGALQKDQYMPDGTLIKWYPDGFKSDNTPSKPANALTSADCSNIGINPVTGKDYPSCITSNNIQQLNLIRPYKGFGPINVYRTDFNANYHSLQASVQKKLAGRGLINVNYTWSKTLTNSQSDTAYLQNTYDPRLDYGYALLDRRHVLTANYVYDLPFFKEQHGFIGKTLGGWEASSIITVNSGLPLTVTQPSGTYGRDAAGLGCIGASGCGYRPNMIGDPNDGKKTFNSWFDTSVFVPTPVNSPVPGNAPRGAVRGPGLWRVDFSMFKNVKMTERMNLQVRAETFNIFNHTNYQGVNSTNLGSNTFGYLVYTNTRDPRVMQLGLKLNF